MKKKTSYKKNRVKKRFVIESVVIFLLILAPFIFKLHGYLSRDPEATLQLFGFVIDRNGFPNIRTHIWFLSSKFIPLYLLTIWFFTCKQWWYHIILIPLLMYAFQTFEVIYSVDDTVDTENLFWLLPVCMVVIPFVYFIRIKLYDKHVHGIDLDAMEAEIQVIRNERDVKEKKSPASAPSTAPVKTPEEIDYKSLSEKIDEKLSTDNLESIFRQFQNQLGDWLHFR